MIAHILEWGGWILLAFLILVICIAYSMLNNPYGRPK